MLLLSELIFIVAIGLSTAAIAIFLLKLTQPRSPTLATPAPEPMALLFDDGVLHHANTAALKKFAFFPGTHVWADLRAGLLARFPDFPETAGTGSQGSITLLSKQAQDHTTVDVNWRDGMCWVHLNETDATQASLNATNQDTRPIERFAKTLAQPVWEMDEHGQVGWRNTAFDQLVQRTGTRQTENPFDPFETTDKQRCVVTDSNGAHEWYEVTTHQFGTSTMHHATCITALVRAEEAQRTFVQTLAKTFAHLPVGLAIFDKHGQLGIFNPALVDLSGLQASFLATRPTMLSFFDALRESRRMPEPKNYRTWRQDIADVISAASDGQYHETWTLEDGRTYTVQGRPHPDGATAFLIEDISAEITLSRSYRAEVEQFEALLDSVGDALVVFSSTGVLTFCNAAYREMWEQNPEAAFADVTINDAVDLWASKTQGDIPWKDISVFTSTLGPKQELALDLRQSNGAMVQCILSPLAADATLIRFSPVTVLAEPSKTSKPAKGPGKKSVPAK